MPPRQSRPFDKPQHGSLSNDLAKSGHRKLGAKN